MWVDEIVEEVCAARHAHSAKFNYDLKAIYDDLKAQEVQSHRKVVSFAVKRIEKQPDAE